MFPYSNLRTKWDTRHASRRPAGRDGFLSGSRSRDRQMSCTSRNAGLSIALTNMHQTRKTKEVGTRDADVRTAQTPDTDDEQQHQTKIANAWTTDAESRRERLTQKADADNRRGQPTGGTDARRRQPTRKSNADNGRVLGNTSSPSETRGTRCKGPWKREQRGVKGC